MQFYLKALPPMSLSRWCIFIPTAQAVSVLKIPGLLPQWDEDRGALQPEAEAHPGVSSYFQYFNAALYCSSLLMAE